MNSEIVIIGAGPSGMSCAIQLKRSGFDAVIFEKNLPGGLLNNANLVENYPGFPGGISGKDLSGLFKKQLDDVGVEIANQEVQQVNFVEERFLITTSTCQHESRILVLASGTSPNGITEPHIPSDCKDHIYHEIYPLLNSSGKRIAIIGAGDAAFDYALNLGRKNQVFILNRTDKSRALQLLRDRVAETEAIEYKTSIGVNSIERCTSGIKLGISCDGLSSSMDVDYLVLATGRKPCVGYISDYIISNMNELEDSRALWRIGDLINGNRRQAAIAVGDGLRAAMEITESLKERHA